MEIVSFSQLSLYIVNDPQLKWLSVVKALELTKKLLYFYASPSLREEESAKTIWQTTTLGTHDVT